MAFAYALDPTTPPGGEAASLGAGRIRDLKNAMIERVNSRFVSVDADPWIIKSPVSGGNTQSLLPTSDNTYVAGSAALRFADLRSVLATIGTLVVTSSSGTSATFTTFTGALVGNASTSTKLITARTINGVLFDGSANITISAGTVGTLTFGTHLTSGDASFGGSNATITSDATDAAAASTIVARDASKGFSAGAIAVDADNTRNLGAVATRYANVYAVTFTGALVGNASSATTAGTVTTAAQSAITSVGTLTALTVSGAFSSGAATVTTLAGTGVLSGFTTAGFSGAVTVTIAGMTNSVKLGQVSDATTYGLLTFNGTVTGAGLIGILGGASGDDAMYVQGGATAGVRLRVAGTSRVIVLDATCTISSTTTAVQALTAAGVIRNDGTSGGFAMGVISSVPRITYNSGTTSFAFLTAGNGDATLTTGHLYAETDAIFDIGQSSSALRFRDLFLSRNATLAGSIFMATGGEIALTGGGSTLATTFTVSRWNGSSYATIATFSADLALTGNMSVASTKKMFLDGGGDTYIIESAANQLDLIVGARQVFRANASDLFLDLFSTASAANMNYSGGTGAVRVVSSSARFKTDINTLSYDEAAKLIFGSRPVTFRSSILGDDPTVNYLGFIAEEIDLLEPRLCIYLDGQVQSLQYDRFIVPVVTVLQDHERRLKQLEHAPVA